MISKEAVTAKKKLFQNKNLEDVINIPLKIQRKEWEDSARNAKLPENIKIEEIIIRDIKSGLDNSRIY